MARIRKEEFKGRAVLFIYDPVLYENALIEEYIEGEHEADPITAAQEGWREVFQDAFPNAIMAIGSNERARKLKVAANNRKLSPEAIVKTSKSEST